MEPAYTGGLTHLLRFFLTNTPPTRRVFCYMSVESLNRSIDLVADPSVEDPTIIFSTIVAPKGVMFFDLSPKMRTALRQDFIGSITNRGISLDEVLFSGYDMNASTESFWNGSEENYGRVEYPKFFAPDETWFFSDTRGIYAGRGDKNIFNPFSYAMFYKRGMPTIGIYLAAAICDLGAKIHGPHSMKLSGDLADIDDNAKITDYRIRVCI